MLLRFVLVIAGDDSNIILIFFRVWTIKNRF